MMPFKGWLISCCFLICLASKSIVVAQSGWTAITTGNRQVERLFQALNGPDSGQAIQGLRQLADAGDNDAKFALARAYQLGMGVTASESKAKTLLEDGQAVDHPASIVAIAVLLEPDNGSEALHLYSRAAELGQPLAELRLGRGNENADFGLSRNPEMAVEFYRRAHDAGLPIATYELGRCYLNGIGVAPDALVSTRLLRQAAESNVPAAARLMSEAYKLGRGMKRDNIAAVGWLLYAAQLGDRDALVQLGRRFENGDGVVPNLNQAGQYYSAAAKRGDQVAQYRLAMLYIEGRGTKADPVRGYVLLDAIRGLPPADKELGKLESRLTTEQLAKARQRIDEQKNSPPR